MDKLSGLIQDAKKRAPNKNLHSEMHVLADEISAYFGERKRFGMYLGIIKRLGTDRTRQIFSRIKSESEGADDPRKLFMWLTSEKAREQKDEPDIAKKDET